MARPKRSNEFEDPDFDSPQPQGEALFAPASSAAVQPPPVDPVPKLTDGKKILAELFNISMDDVQALVKAKEDASTFALAAQAQEYAQKMKSEIEQRHIRDKAAKTAQERTQEVVDKNWGGDPSATRYRVALVANPEAQGKPESITLTIPAHSREEAQGRYLSVCGIRSTDHFVVAEPVPQKDGGNAA